MAMDGLPTFVALQISAGGYKEFPELRQADTHIVNVHPNHPLTEIHLVAGEYHMMGAVKMVKFHPTKTAAV